MTTGQIKTWWVGRYRLQIYWPYLGLAEIDGIYQIWGSFPTGARFGFSRNRKEWDISNQWLGGFKILGFGIGIHCHPVDKPVPSSN